MVFLTEIIVFSVGYKLCLNTYLKHLLSLGQPVPWPGWLVTASQLGSPGFILGWSMWDLWLKKWYWDRFLSLVIPLSHLSIIHAVLHTRHHFNTTEKRTSVWGFKPPNIVITFQMFGIINEKSNFTLIFCVWKNEIVVLWSG